MSLEFHLLSFIAGFVSALLLVNLLYRRRATLALARERFQDWLQEMRKRFTASVAERYATSLITDAQTMHLLGGRARLDQIWVEPCLISASPLKASPPPGTAPQPEFKPFSALEALEASDRLLITGKPGSGRTMLLNHLLLNQCGLLLQSPNKEHVPLYVYLPAVAFTGADSPDPDSDEEQPDDNDDDNMTFSLDRLVRAAAMRMSRLTSGGAARWLEKQVEAGQTLILLDGWDELTLEQQAPMTAWIQELLQVHPDNCIVVVAGERGYGALAEADFVPLTILAWSRSQLGELSERWAKVWSGDDGPPLEPPPIHYGSTPPTPFFATLQTAIQLQGKALAPTLAGRMEQALEILLPPPEVDEDEEPEWHLQTGHEALNCLAFSVLTNNVFLERDQIESAVTETMPPPQFDAEQMLAVKRAELQPEIELDEDDELDQDDVELDKDEKRAIAEEKEDRYLQVVDCCRALTHTGGMIQSWADQGYLFEHPLLAAYLAARHLAKTEQGTLVVAHVDDPAWREVCRFYAAMSPVEPLLERLMTQPDDLFLNRLRTAGAWLAAAPPAQLAWRSQLMKRLGQTFMNPQMPPLLRHEAMKSLVDSGDANVSMLFRQIAPQGDAYAREFSVLGLGFLSREQDLDILEVALDDAELPVKLAAVEALKNVGGEKALELLVAAILSGEDRVQRMAAEALADFGEEGHKILREATQDEDLVVRRSSAHGLAAVDEDWAWALIEENLLKDKEWFVHNAAESLLTAHEQKREIDLNLPRLEDEGWLISWAASQGEGVGVGEAAIEPLMRALEDEDPETRWRAVDTLRRLSMPRSVPALRQTLRDPELLIRYVVFDALEEISRRYNLTISPS